MKTMVLITAAISGLTVCTSALADKASAPGQDKTCLVTFNSPGAVAGGADADITNTKYLPRKAADKQASKNDTMATFDYPSGSPGLGSNTKEVCSALDPS